VSKFPQRITGSVPALILAIAAMFVAASGCATEPSLPHDLAHDGYLYWFPAESTIEPGDVYLYDSAVRGKFAGRPPSVVVSAPQPTKVEVESLPTSLRSRLDPDTIKRSISKAGPFSAELHAGTATGGEISYGPTTVRSISTTDLQMLAENPQADTGYARAVQLVRDGKPGLMLVASVLTVPEVVMTINCTDPNQLVSRLPQFRQFTDAMIEIKVLDIHRAELTMRPPAGRSGLVVGIQPVRGKDVGLSVEQSRQQLALAGQYATSQQFTFRSGVQTLKGVPGVVGATDSAADVDAKYASAINGSGDSATPSTMPGSWRGRAETPPINSSPANPVSGDLGKSAPKTVVAGDSNAAETPKSNPATQSAGQPRDEIAKPASATEKAADRGEKVDPATQPATPIAPSVSPSTLPADGGK
jgi:hypothetical protein